MSAGADGIRVQLEEVDCHTQHHQRGRVQKHMGERKAWQKYSET